MRTFLLLCLIFVSLLSPSIAQNPADYNRAKTLIGYGNYSEAMDLLRPYMDKNQFGRLSFYATYHFARAAYQNGQYMLTESTLKDLVQQDSWGHQDRARYLLALAYFQEGRNIDALELISKISEPNVRGQAHNASYNFLKNASVGFFTGNIRKFNDNKGFMLALKEQMERQTVMSNEERSIYNELKNLDFGNGNKEIKSPKNPDVLDIAVLLPFRYSGERDIQSLDPNNFIFEFFQGLDFAANELKKQGKQLNIQTFDTEREVSKVHAILANPFLKQADIIIGPVYPEESDIVMAFAEQYQIPFVNPLSNMNDRFEDLQYAYLFRPSVNSMADGIIDFSRKNFVGRRLAIGYSNASRDQQLAKKIAENSQKLGYTIVRNDPINGRSVIDFLEQIQLKSGDEALADVIIILSDDPNVASPTFGFMESQNINKPVLVMDSWLYFNFANYEMLEQQNFYFVSNNAIDFQKPNLEIFRENFYAEYVAYPSFNSHMGYELMQWVLQNINPKSGFELRKNLDKNGFQNGFITYGFDFRRSNFNRYVPMLKLDSGKVVEQK
ncbi:ABC transporter substrate-binding protein [Cecembia sp.]|uniref:ABC transporter substrate-binding protein n=2 Tax=Cecembia sp. TaxID=1898110 RepID=UPI0025C5E20D|nr:ABC transporter substrate-binding protein [Cecembia sp.]